MGRGSTGAPSGRVRGMERSVAQPVRNQCATSMQPKAGTSSVAAEGQAQPGKKQPWLLYSQMKEMLHTEDGLPVRVTAALLGSSHMADYRLRHQMPGVIAASWPGAEVTDRVSMAKAQEELRIAMKKLFPNGHEIDTVGLCFGSNDLEARHLDSQQVIERIVEGLTEWIKCVQVLFPKATVMLMQPPTRLLGPEKCNGTKILLRRWEALSSRLQLLADKEGGVFFNFGGVTVGRDAGLNAYVDPAAFLPKNNAGEQAHLRPESYSGLWKRLESVVLRSSGGPLAVPAEKPTDHADYRPGVKFHRVFVNRYGLTPEGCAARKKPWERDGSSRDIRMKQMPEHNCEYVWGDMAFAPSLKTKVEAGAQPS